MTTTNYPYEITLEVAFRDIDAMGHVNNTIYFRYFETVRIDWFQKIGAVPGPQGVGPVIVNAFCSFIRQIEYPGEVLAKHYVANPGRTSFDTYMTLERTDQPGVIYTEGGAKTVWVDFPKQKSVPLPDWIRDIVG